MSPSPRHARGIGYKSLFYALHIEHLHIIVKSKGQNVENSHSLVKASEKFDKKKPLPSGGAGAFMVQGKSCHLT